MTFSSIQQSCRIFLFDTSSCATITRDSATDEAGVKKEYHDQGYKSTCKVSDGQGRFIPINGIINWAFVDRIIITWYTFANLQEVVNDGPNEINERVDRRPNSILDGPESNFGLPRADFGLSKMRKGGTICDRITTVSIEYYWRLVLYEFI